MLTFAQNETWRALERSGWVFLGFDDSTTYPKFGRNGEVVWIDPNGALHRLLPAVAYADQLED